MNTFLELFFSNYKFARKHIGGFWWYSPETKMWLRLSGHLLQHVEIFKRYQHEDYR